MTQDRASGCVCASLSLLGNRHRFLHTDVAPILQRNDRLVLYFGDFDLQGHQIEANTRRVLEHKARRRIDWNRIAITEEQIAQRGLTPILKKNHRFTTDPGGRGNSKHGSARPWPGHHPTPRPGCLGRPAARTAQRCLGREAEQRVRVAELLDELDE